MGHTPRLKQAWHLIGKCLPLSSAAFDNALRTKRVEEAQEVAGTDTREALMLELADVLEGVESLMAWYGIEAEGLRAVQIVRRRERGEFRRGEFAGFCRV